MGGVEMDVNDDNVAESDMVVIKLFIVAFIICRIISAVARNELRFDIYLS
jgi:hypothetical protein